MIDYQTQQYKLFPQIANAYAFLFSGTRLRNIYFSTNSEIQQGNIDMLPEVRNNRYRKFAILATGRTQYLLPDVHNFCFRTYAMFAAGST